MALLMPITEAPARSSPRAIVIVGGLGASKFYFAKFAGALSQAAGQRVITIELLHGVSLEAECDNVMRVLVRDSQRLAKGGNGNRVSIRSGDAASRTEVVSYDLLGFSTGCIVASSLSLMLREAEHPCVQIRMLILVNPAELLFRFSRNVLLAIMPDAARFPHVSARMELLPTGSLSVWACRWAIFVAAGIWNSSIYFLGSALTARIYYHLHARHVNEPTADELSRLAFRKRLQEIVVTATDCIIKPNLPLILRRLGEQGQRVFIVAGREDFYEHFSSRLAAELPNVTLHRLVGDHHVLYHHPISSASRVWGLMSRGNQ